MELQQGENNNNNIHKVKEGQRFVDPHFHVWDFESPTNPGGHNLDWLGDASRKHMSYVEESYLQDVRESMEQSLALRFEGSVWMEALSDEPLKEAQWVQSMADKQHGKWIRAMVAYAYLPSDDIEEQLITLTKLPLMRGIRQIINHHPTKPNLIWPKVHSAHSLTTDEKFRRGYGLLAKYGLSFDLLLNPIQLKDAAHFMAQFPDVPVCIDHIACLRLRDCTLDERDAMIAEWREGMRECATLPHVYVKISQLWFVLFGWHEKDSAEELLVKSLVKEVIDLFTPERCMYATNFPVDKVHTSSVEVYQRFLAWNDEWCLDAQAIDQLLYVTAAKFYKFA